MYSLINNLFQIQTWLTYKTYCQRFNTKIVQISKLVPVLPLESRVKIQACKDKFLVEFFEKESSTIMAWWKQQVCKKMQNANKMPLLNSYAKMCTKLICEWKQTRTFYDIIWLICWICKFWKSVQVNSKFCNIKKRHIRKYMYS